MQHAWGRAMSAAKLWFDERCVLVPYDPTSLKKDPGQFAIIFNQIRDSYVSQHPRAVMMSLINTRAPKCLDPGELNVAFGLLYLLCIHFPSTHIGLVLEPVWKQECQKLSEVQDSTRRAIIE